MNWILAAVGIIFLIGIIVGIARGALKIIVSLAATLLTFVLVFFLSPYVAKGITSLTPVGDVIQSGVESFIADAAARALTGGAGGAEITEDSVRSALSAAGVSEEELNAMGITVEDIADGEVTGEDLAQYGISGDILNGLNADEEQIQQEAGQVELSRDAQTELINGADIPDVLKNLLLTNNNNEIYSRLEADNFVSYVGKYLTRLIVNILSFLLTFVIVTIIIRAVVFALDFVAELPGVGFVNRLAGGVLGMIGALVVVWFLFLIITFLYLTDFGKDMYLMIQENGILKMIYDNNPVFALATMFR